MYVANYLPDTSVVTAETVEAPAIQPASAPVYQPAVAPVAPLPLPSQPPVGQQLGSGGTPFTIFSGGLKPLIYTQPMILPKVPVDIGYAPPPNVAFMPNQPAPLPPDLPARPGDKANVQLPPNSMPAKPDVPKNPDLATVPKPGPIAGM